MVPVKICGITRIEDAMAAARAGAHALGFVFYPPSPRNVHPEVAREIIEALPPFITSVALFVDASVEEVRSVISRARVSLLQFHGEETPEYCAAFPLPYIKAVRMSEKSSLVQSATVHKNAKALLLDAFVDGTPGGTGHAFDWNLVPPNVGKPIVLSGGLTPANVADAIRRVRPWAVDVSSGVEAAKGIKDAAKIASFMQGVRSADV